MSHVPPAPTPPVPAGRRGLAWAGLILLLGLLTGVLGVLLPGLLGGRPANEAVPGTPNPSEALPLAALPISHLEVTA